MEHDGIWLRVGHPLVRWSWLLHLWLLVLYPVHLNCSELRWIMDRQTGERVVGWLDFVALCWKVCWNSGHGHSEGLDGGSWICCMDAFWECRYRCLCPLLQTAKKRCGPDSTRCQISDTAFQQENQEKHFGRNHRQNLILRFKFLRWRMTNRLKVGLANLGAVRAAVLKFCLNKRSDHWLFAFLY